jgi:hypothetical protein
MTVDLTEVSEWQGNAHLVVEGVDFGFFQKRTGGAPSAESSKWGSGGMQPGRARGGKRSKSQIVLTRAYSPARDGALYSQFEDRVGRARVSGADLVLDLDENVLESKPFAGMLQGLDRGDYDDGSNDQRNFTVTIDSDD